MVEKRTERLLMTPEEYKQVQNIYLELLEVPENERLTLLEKKDLAEHLKTEVESLLGHTDENTIIDQKTIKVHTPPPPTPPRKNFIKTLFSASLAIRTSLVIGLAIIIVLGLRTHNQVKWTLKDIRESELRTTINSLKQSLQLWIDDYKHDVTRLSADREFREMTMALLDEVNDSDSNEYLRSEQHKKIRDLLIDLVDPSRYSGYAIINKNGVSISSNESIGIGLELSTEAKSHYLQVLEGKTVFTPPTFTKKREGIPDDSPLFKQANVWVHVPIKDLNGNIIASFSVARNAHSEFSKLFKINRLGKTGESYVVNKYGLLLSESRFGEDLQATKLTHFDDSTGMLELYIKDPGVDLTKGERPLDSKVSWRLTKAAQTLSAFYVQDTNEFGISLEPYRDYRGVDVIGAWVLMKEYGFGIITEMDEDEAYEALPYLNIAFAVLIAIVSLLFIYSSVKSLRVQALTKQMTEGRVGNYILGKKIGEGGMSKVYLASHDMLKRPTAIKILKKEELNDRALSRFKTEVIQVSRLRHPNTISIYDYGETENGIFYYAMEYVDGLTIKDIVKMNGSLPLARVLHVLTDCCHSLKEAHDLNLIHRDVKPQNIMLCVQGGVYDMVKVLDFGLVKDLENHEEELTRQTEITGTPLYMAPERITNPEQADQRSDIYAIGAVAYYMITGRPLFEYKNDLDVMASIINETPKPVIQINEETPQLLSNLIDVCLDKDADNRPENIDYLIAIFEKLAQDFPWTQKDAKKWWLRFKG